MSDRLRKALVANLFDGDDGGTVTAPIASLVDDIVDVVQSPTEDGEVYLSVDRPHPVPLHPAPTEDATLDVDRLARALVMCGYPPVHELHASQGASGHYEHDNAAYAAAIAREYGAKP